MHAVFKADGEETEDRYCVSEWWLEAGDLGPGPHLHDHNVELFYVIEGTMSFLAGRRGSMLRLVLSCASQPESRRTSRTAALNAPVF